MYLGKPHLLIDFWENCACKGDSNALSRPLALKEREGRRLEADFQQSWESRAGRRPGGSGPRPWRVLQQFPCEKSQTHPTRASRRLPIKG